MTTLAILKARIADELARSDLTSQIAYAIEDAVKHYQSTRFWFNETRNETFATVTGQEFYDTAENAHIPDLLQIDQLTFLDGPRRFRLYMIDDRLLEELDPTANTGTPSMYSYYGQKIRLYPIPDAVYSVRITGVLRIPVPASDVDSNAWTTDGEELIRESSKSRLYRHVVRNAEMAAASMNEEKGALRRLLVESSRRKGISSVQPVEF